MWAVLGPGGALQTWDGADGLHAGGRDDDLRGSVGDSGTAHLEGVSPLSFPAGRPRCSLPSRALLAGRDPLHSGAADCRWRFAERSGASGDGHDRVQRRLCDFKGQRHLPQLVALQDPPHRHVASTGNGDPLIAPSAKRRSTTIGRPVRCPHSLRTGHVVQCPQNEWRS